MTRHLPSEGNVPPSLSLRICSPTVVSFILQMYIKFPLGTSTPGVLRLQ